MPLTEALLIVQWLEVTRPAPEWPALLGTGAATDGILSRAGIALGAIEASTITIITRKVTAPTLFDVIAAVTLFDYQQLRHADQAWLPKTPRLQALAQAWNARPSFATTRPYIPA